MIHSCVEAYIEDVSHTLVDIKQPCCCNTVNICPVIYETDITVSNVGGIYNIIDVCGDALIGTDTINKAFIALEWVCGTGYSVNYLRVTPTETVWISIEYSVDYNVESNTDWIVS